MTFYAIDARGWFDGEIDQEIHGGSVTIMPPVVEAQSPAPGLPWPRWCRYAWRVELYAEDAPVTQSIAYAFDADGWYTGTAAVGTPCSTSAKPDITSTSATPGDPRARWGTGGWSVQAYPEPTAPRVTKRAFWGRFPAANETAMRAVIIGGSPLLLAAGLQRLQARVEASPYVELTLAETIAGIAWLQSDQVPETVTIDGAVLPLRLTSQQAAAILDQQIADGERPT